MKYLILSIALFISIPALAETVTADSQACHIQRDDKGRIARSKKVISDFKRHNPCPSTGKTSSVCKGYVIDHVVPLCACGKDFPENMQWQTIEDAKIKDRWERTVCQK